MTARGFLLCYAGAVILVAGVGASAYQALQHQRVAASASPAPVAVAEAEPPSGGATSSPETTQAPPATKPRPHVVKAAKPNVPDHQRATIAHLPARRPATIASARRLVPPGGPWPYAAPPPPPYPGFYAYPAQYPDYYPYYPRYGYYRSF
jgi:hypothetical protein